MCNNQTTQPQAQQPPVVEEQIIDKDIKKAELEMQLAQIRANAEYNASVAGQVQRQFETMQRCAKPYAESTIVPTAYRGNIGNCVIAVDLAHRMNLPILSVMQNLYVVNGNPSWSSKFLVATINSCGRFTNLRYRKRNLGPLGKTKYNSIEYSKEKKEKTIVLREYDATGIDNWECIAYAVEKSTGETLESDPVTIEMAIKEGWYTKDGSKWVTMPMLMLTYRAAAFWQRVYAPEISMGFRTYEEERDIIDTDYEEISSKTPAGITAHTVEEAKEKLRQRAAGKTNGTAAQPKADAPAPDSAAGNPQTATTGTDTPAAGKPMFDMP